MHDDELFQQLEPTPDVDQPVEVESFTLETTSQRSSLMRRIPIVFTLSLLYFVLRGFDPNYVFNPVNADIFIFLNILAMVSSIYGLSLVVKVKEEEYHFKNVYKIFKRTNEILDFFGVIPALMVIFTVVNMTFVSFSPISGTSMEPNFHDDEAVIFQHNLDSFERFDVVIIYVEELVDPYLIKRVIGLPGETVVIDHNEIYINGELLVQDFIDQDLVTTYCISASDINYCEFQVPQNEYFVLGDNRDGHAVVGQVSGYSVDSRTFGTVPVTDIFGKVILTFKDYNLLD